MDAEDIRVYVDASIPSSCDVKAYAKLQNAADPGDFQEDLSWIELSKIGYPAEQTENFAEYYWQLPSKPASGKNIAGVNGSGIFEYDLINLTLSTHLESIIKLPPTKRASTPEMFAF